MRLNYGHPPDNAVASLLLSTSFDPHQSPQAHRGPKHRRVAESIAATSGERSAGDLRGKRASLRSATCLDPALFMFRVPCHNPPCFEISWYESLINSCVARLFRPELPGPCPTCPLVSFDLLLPVPGRSTSCGSPLSLRLLPKSRGHRFLSCDHRCSSLLRPSLGSAFGNFY